jgi:hypothetical protein
MLTQSNVPACQFIATHTALGIALTNKERQLREISPYCEKIMDWTVAEQAQSIS